MNSAVLSSRRTRPKVLTLVIFFLLGNLLVGYLTSTLTLVRLHQRKQEIQKEIRRIEAENAQLQKHISYLKSPAYVEKVAREKLGLVKPDEVKYVVAQPVDKDNPWDKDVPRRPGAEKNQSFY